MLSIARTASSGCGVLFAIIKRKPKFKLIPNGFVAENLKLIFLRLVFKSHPPGFSSVPRKEVVVETTRNVSSQIDYVE